MAISVGGLNLVRPTVSVTTEYSSDSNQNVIGITDNVSVTDTVFSTDTSDLTSIYNNALDLSLNPAPMIISYPGNDNVKAYIQGVSAGGDSDFATKLVYTVTFKAIPNRSFFSKYPVVGTNCQSISYSQSIDIPHDMDGVELPVDESELTEEDPESNIIFNKPASYTCSVQVQCGSTESSSAFENADSVACALFSSVPTDEIKPTGFGTFYPYSFSRTDDKGAGSVSINCVAYGMPTGAMDGMLTAEQSISETINHVENYIDKSYQLTVTKLPILSTVDCSGSKASSDLSSEPLGIVQGVLEVFMANSGISGVTVGEPGSQPVSPCILTLPEFTNSGCGFVKSMNVEENKGSNSATLTVEVTNQNAGFCGDDDYDATYSITRKPRGTQKTLIEVQGWSSTGYWVQNMNVAPDTVYEYSIDATSKRKCPGTGTEIIAYTTGLFSELDYMGGSGIITSKVISVNDNKCSLKITQYSGANLSTDDVGYGG